MKHLKFLILIIFFLFTISTLSQTVNYGNWDLKWTNDGNIGWINDWHIDINDDYYKLRGNLNGRSYIDKSAFFINMQNGYYQLANFGTDNDWNTIIWNIGGENNYIWYDKNGLKSSDYNTMSEFIPFKANDNQSAILFITYDDNSPFTSYWQNMMLFNPYQIYDNYTPTVGVFRLIGNTIWSSVSYNYFYIGGVWKYNTSDHFICGNFYGSSTSEDEILCLQSDDIGNNIKIYQMTTGYFTELFSSTSTIGGWTVRFTDRFSVIDIDGDENDELLCFNTNTKWASILNFENN